MKKGSIALNWILGIIGLAALLFAGFTISPSTAKIDGQLEAKKILRADIDKKVADLNQANGVLMLPAGTDGAMPVSEETVVKSIPATRQYEDLYAMLENELTGLGLESNTAITVGKASSDAVGTVTSTPVTITVQTSYDTVKTLLSQLSNTLRPISINAVIMTAQTGGSVQANITATAYTQTTAAEQAATTNSQ